VLYSIGEDSMRVLGHEAAQSKAGRAMQRDMLALYSVAWHVYKLRLHAPPSIGRMTGQDPTPDAGSFTPTEPMQGKDNND
jgi:hypothetical protein